MVIVGDASRSVLQRRQDNRQGCRGKALLKSPGACGENTMLVSCVLVKSVLDDKQLSHVQCYIFS